MEIKYDLKQRKKLLILTACSIALLILGITLSMLEIEVVEAICPLIDIGGFVMFIFCGLNTINASIYLNDLKRYGYEVPYDKRVYNSRIEKLPRNINSDEINDDMIDERNSDSLYLMKIYFVIFFSLIGWNVWFFIRWRITGESVLAVVMSVFDLIWMIYAIRFYCHSDNSKYRDSVEIDNNRKERISLVRGIAYIFILGVITFIVKATVFNMTEYVYRSRVAVEQNYICDIQNAFNTNYQDFRDDETVKNDLKKGIVLTSESNIPSGEYYDNVASTCGVSNLNEIANSLRIAPENAYILVKLEKDNIIVSYENDAKYVKLSFKSTGAEGERWLID